MAGSQSFTKRVLVPLLTIVLTVSSLAVVGLSLLNVSSGSSVVTSTSSQAPTPVATSVTGNGYLPVSVFNGSTIAGLARKRASKLEELNWTVATIGNWTGPKVKQSTLFYPANAKDSALALAAQINVRLESAPTSLSQTELTYVIAK